MKADGILITGSSIPLGLLLDMSNILLEIPRWKYYLFQMLFSQRAIFIYYQVQWLTGQKKSELVYFEFSPWMVLPQQRGNVSEGL